MPLAVEPPRDCRRPQLLRRWGRYESTTNKFSTEVRSRAVRMVLDHEGEHPSRWAAVCSGVLNCREDRLHATDAQ